MVAVGRGHRFARRRAVFLREVIGDTFVTGSDAGDTHCCARTVLTSARRPGS